MQALIFGTIALNIYAVLLILARARVFRAPLYRPMLWNVVLSILPIGVLVIAIVSFVAVSTIAPTSLAYTVLALCGVVWLLVLPNASYLITELNFSHRERDEARVPLWYDIILVITLAMSGVANTVINVFIVHLLYATTLATGDTSQLFSWQSMLVIAAVMLLVGLGMYLGRYLRVNSWDLRHPFAFARKVIAHFRNPANVWACAGFTVTYALFLGIMYAVIVGPLGLSHIDIGRVRLG